MKWRSKSVSSTPTTDDSIIFFMRVLPYNSFLHVAHRTSAGLKSPNNPARWLAEGCLPESSNHAETSQCSVFKQRGAFSEPETAPQRPNELVCFQRGPKIDWEINKIIRNTEQTHYEATKWLSKEMKHSSSCSHRKLINSSVAWWSRGSFTTLKWILF